MAYGPPFFIPYEPFLLGVVVVYNLLIQRSSTTKPCVEDSFLPPLVLTLSVLYW